MSAKKWMQWLSVIALILIVGSVLYGLSGAFCFTASDNGCTPTGANITITDLTILLLAVIAVISSWSKK